MAHEHGSVARREAGLSVGEIARAHGERVRAEHALSPEQHKVLRAIDPCSCAMTTTSVTYASRAPSGVPSTANGFTSDCRRASDKCV